MDATNLPPLERGDLARIVKLSKLRKLNEGKGYSYAYVKACLMESNPRKNEEIDRLALEIRVTRKNTMEVLELLSKDKATVRK